MTRYQKKPETVRAFRYLIDASPKWFEESDVLLGEESGPNPYCKILTSIGLGRAYQGDWVLETLGGGLMAMNAEVFHQMFTEVEEH